jgi:hypothetical protein
MLGDEAVHDGLQLTGVHGLEPLRRSDGSRVATLGHERGQHRLGLRGGQVAPGLQGDEGGERLVGQEAHPVSQVVLEVHQHPACVGAQVDRGHGEAVEAPVHGQGGSERLHAGSLGKAVAPLPGEQRHGGTDLGDPFL